MVLRCRFHFAEVHNCWAGYDEMRWQKTETKMNMKTGLHVFRLRFWLHHALARIYGLFFFPFFFFSVHGSHLSFSAFVLVLASSTRLLMITWESGAVLQHLSFLLEFSLLVLFVGSSFALVRFVRFSSPCTMTGTFPLMQVMMD